MHCGACFWIWSGAKTVGTGGWKTEFELEDETPMVKYINCIEFITATFTTIGYGNMYALTPFEKCVMMVMIMFGLIVFALVM